MSKLLTINLFQKKEAASTFETASPFKLSKKEIYFFTNLIEETPFAVVACNT